MHLNATADLNKQGGTCAEKILPTEIGHGRRVGRIEVQQVFTIKSAQS